jgi:hypothetical protein
MTDTPRQPLSHFPRISRMISSRPAADRAEPRIAEHALDLHSRM